MQAHTGAAAGAGRDQARIAAWREETWPLVKTAPDVGAWLSFEDSRPGLTSAPRQNLGSPRDHPHGEGDRRAQYALVAGRADRRPALAPSPAALPRAPQPRRPGPAPGASPRRTTPGCWTRRIQQLGGPLVRAGEDPAQADARTGPGLLDGFLASTRLNLTPFGNPRD